MVNARTLLIATLAAIPGQALSDTGSNGQWNKLIRFKDTQDAIHYGEPQVSSGDDVIPAFETGTLKAVVLQCDSFIQCGSKRGATVDVKELLSPLTKADVPVVRNVALNYLTHIQQGNATAPPFPSEFMKGRTAVNQWNSLVPVPTIAENNSTDFEGELICPSHRSRPDLILCFVVSKDAKDVPRSEVLSHIGGFFVGNDVSNRLWQLNASFAGTQPQFDFSKGFDGWAPLGPVIVSPSIIGAANNLTLTTTVNGKLRQNSSTSELIFGVIEFAPFQPRHHD